MSKNVGVEWMTMIADLAYLCSVAVVSYGLVTQPHIWSNVFLLVPMAMVVALWVSDRRINTYLPFLRSFYLLWEG